MVEAELALFEVEQEGVRVHPAEPRQPALGVAPEALDAVDVVAGDPSAAELVGPVIDPQVLLAAHVHQAVVARPAVGADDAVEADFAPNRRQKHCFRAVGHHLGVDLVAAFVDAEDGRLPARAPAGFALDAAWTEVAFVDLDGAAEGPFELARLGHALSQAGQEPVGRVAVESCELGDLYGCEIGRHMPQEASKNGLGDSRTGDIAGLHSKTSLSRPSGKAQLVMTQMKSSGLTIRRESIPV